MKKKILPLMLIAAAVAVFLTYEVEDSELAE